MSGPIPALGYRSRTEAARALSAQGLPDRAIAARLGISTKNVGALLASAAGRKRPNERTVVFPLDVLDRLRPYAARRAISVNELARRIVETALDESMIENILDDGGASP